MKTVIKTLLIGLLFISCKQENSEKPVYYNYEVTFNNGDKDTLKLKSPYLVTEGFWGNGETCLYDIGSIRVACGVRVFKKIIK